VLVSMEWLRAREQSRCVWLPHYKEGHMPLLECACGCGELVPSLDSRNQPRHCVPEHGGRLATPHGDLKDWESLALAWNQEAPECACGCGHKLNRTAEQLREGLPDSRFLQGHNRRRARVRELTTVERSVILGGLLGDLCITRPSLTPRLSFTHGIDQLEYAQHKMKVLGRLSWWSVVACTSGYVPDKLGVRGSCSCLPALEEIWGLVRPQGPKSPNPGWLEHVDDRGLAYWFMDDGSVLRSSTGAVYGALLHTQGFSESENRVLSAWLSAKGMRVDVKDYGGFPSLYVPRAAVEPLFWRIRPYVHPSMRYKVDGSFT